MKVKVKSKKRKSAGTQKERRKKIRQMHVIDERSSARDVALARNDLDGFFLDVLFKHHGGSF